MASIRNLEIKFGEIETKIKNPPELPKADKELIREEKEEEVATEQRKLNVIIHQWPESNLDTVEDRKMDDSDTVQSLISEAFSLEVEVENVFRLGAFSKDRNRSRPIRFTVQNMDGNRKVLSASKNLKNVEGYSNVYLK